MHLIKTPKRSNKLLFNKNKLNSIEELGYPQQYEIVNFLKKINKSFTVIDSSELLNNPEKVLSAWCKKINIKFDKSMLSWEKGYHSNDGIWRKFWYDNVIKTNRFQKYGKKILPLRINMILFIMNQWSTIII